jgi:hypothetical protein
LTQSPNLAQPADAAAAGFYAANPHNHFIGNAASGGWAGFSFPTLPRPVGVRVVTGVRAYWIHAFVIAVSVNPVHPANG